MIRLLALLAALLLAACGSPVEPQPTLCQPAQAIPMTTTAGTPAPVSVTLAYCYGSQP